MRLIVAILILGAMTAITACAAEPALDGTTPITGWVSPGFFSHHFDRSAGYREDNVGFGAELDVVDSWSIHAGSFINSDRARSRYVGGAWEPLERWGVKAGLYGGAFDGYPAMRAGGWFAAAFPVISMRTDRFGVNLTVIPNYGNRLHGAIVAQVLLRVR